MNLFGWELRKATERPIATFDLSGQAKALGAGELMGPGLPVAPAHPEEVEPRRRDYQPGRNIISAPRAYEPTSFAALRRLCDNYDVARLAIEARKDEARGWEWDIRVRPIPGMKREDQKARAAEFRIELETVRGFLLTPNQEDDFGTWLTMYPFDSHVDSHGGGTRSHGVEPMDASPARHGHETAPNYPVNALRRDF